GSTRPRPTSSALCSCSRSPPPPTTTLGISSSSKDAPRRPLPSIGRPCGSTPTTPMPTPTSPPPSLPRATPKRHSPTATPRSGSTRSLVRTEAWAGVFRATRPRGDATVLDLPLVMRYEERESGPVAQVAEEAAQLGLAWLIFRNDEPPVQTRLRN